jgi:hypothetical protein
MNIGSKYTEKLDFLIMDLSSEKIILELLCDIETRLDIKQESSQRNLMTKWWVA